MKLTRSSGVPGTMRLSGNMHGTRTANSLPAIMIESNRIFSFADQSLIQNIKHLQERHLRRNVFHLIGFKSSFALVTALSPNLEREIHCIMFHAFYASLLRSL